jgi:NADPH:quinone reductase
MKAVVLEGIGEPEQLVVRDVPAPVAAAGQSIVDVRAAAINFLEVLVRRGLYPQMPELPWVPGTEIAGTTEDGRRVLGLVRSTGGGYAEKVALDDKWTFDLPAGASFEEGAGFLMAYLTAWIPLTRQVRVGSGTRVLVHAAAGGVGSAAVVAARHLGAEVVATVGSAAKAELPLSLGAVQAVTYEQLAELEPVDVVVDPVGGRVFADSIPLLRPLGSIIAIGFAAGPWPALDPALLVGRNVGVQGFYLGRLMQREPALVRDAALELLRLWAAGSLHPIVGATFPLADAAGAHRLIEERHSTGKIVLVP